MIRPVGPKWRDDEELKGWLLEHVLGLKAAREADDTNKVAFILMRWLSRRGTFSHKDMLLDHGKLSARELLSAMLAFEGGVWCGGMAGCFAGLLECLGIYAAKWSYGLRKANISHVTTLVGHGDGKSYVFDAYFGYVYVDPETGDLLEFSELLYRVRMGQYHRIKRKDFPSKRAAVAAVGDKGGGFNWCFDRNVPPPEKYDDRWVFQGAQVSHENLYAPGTTNWHRIEKERGDFPFDHFMFDLIITEPHLTRWRGGEEEGVFPTEFSIMRELIYKLARR